ncbi:hypothetical protein CDEST_05214 [Colletotrichum destructivum]|uniref:Uncharacterized protein n=1 Tax=Colletotrichum destructivum TaxID=34406 RepID=A0AAX4I9X6_9PEZI|nr:hypothetical protein CDEST_05214 [Colletotrichum destructivum]
MAPVIRPSAFFSRTMCLTRPLQVKPDLAMVVGTFTSTCTCTSRSFEQGHNLTYLIPTEKQGNQQTAVVQIHPAISRPLPFAKLAETNQHTAWWAFLASYGAEPGALTLQNVVDTDTEHRAVLFRTPRPRQDSRKEEHQPMPPHHRIQSMVVLVQSYKFGDTVKTIVVDVMGRRCRVASTNNNVKQHTMETQR